MTFAASPEIVLRTMWPDDIHRELAAAQVSVVGYVPDAGHTRLIELCHADQSMRAVVLTTEEEASDSPPARGSAASAACS